MGFPLDLTGDGGVLKTVLKEADDAEQPVDGHEVEVHYTGTLESGTVFDSSYNRNTSFKFILGAGNVIKGWDVGVASMKIGEKASFKIQPEYGYGAKGAGEAIPPNSVLNFDIELINSRVKPKEKWEMSTDEKIQAALDAKLDGNIKFGKGNIAAAITLYEDGVKYLSTRDGWSEDSRKASDLTKMQCHLNLANCYIKSGKYSAAEHNATEALLLDPNNVKGLYRRGIARIHNDSFKDAIDDFNKLLTIEPDNADAQNQLKVAKYKLNLYNQKDKKRYSNIFSNHSIYEGTIKLKRLHNYIRKIMPRGYFQRCDGSDNSACY